MAGDPRPDALTAARALVGERYPACDVAFLAGSVVRGEATPTSDLDVVIVGGIEGAPFRESLIYAGWPVEVFVHTAESLPQWFAKDIERRRPSLPMMCAEGRIVQDRTGQAGAIKAEAAALLTAGPAPLTPAEVTQYRYRITDLRDDLAGSPDAVETFFVAAELAALVCEFVLAYNRRWIGQGKWIPRALRRHDPALAAQLIEAISALTGRDDREPLLALVEATLEPVGGRLFDGYRLGAT